MVPLLQGALLMWWIISFSTEMGISVVEDHVGPEPLMLQLLAPVTPEAGVLIAEEVSEW